MLMRRPLTGQTRSLLPEVDQLLAPGSSARTPDGKQVFLSPTASRFSSRRWPRPRRLRSGDTVTLPHRSDHGTARDQFPTFHGAMRAAAGVPTGTVTRRRGRGLSSPIQQRLRPHASSWGCGSGPSIGSGRSGATESAWSPCPVRRLPRHERSTSARRLPPRTSRRR